MVEVLVPERALQVPEIPGFNRNRISAREPPDSSCPQGSILPQSLSKKMPFSHHSHSGQFCGHAKNSLEEMVQTAISKGMRMYALTEHMPREVEDFYPEEVC